MLERRAEREPERRVNKLIKELFPWVRSQQSYSQHRQVVNKHKKNIKEQNRRHKRPDFDLEGAEEYLRKHASIGKGCSLT
jgi:hypothetical protein